MPESGLSPANRMSGPGRVALDLTQTCRVLLTASHREELAVPLQEEEEDMEEVAGALEEEAVEEEVAGPQGEEAVEEKSEDPTEELPLLGVKEKEAEEEQEVGNLQVEDVAVEEEGPHAASPALHLPSSSLAALVKAKVKLNKRAQPPSRFSL